MATTVKKMLNFSLFYLCWFGTVYGVVAGWPWLGPAAILLYLTLHWFYIVPSTRELVFILTGGLIGYGADHLFLVTGTVQYPVAGLGLFTPIWMLFVWFSFLSMFHVSLQWLRTRPYLAGLLGAVGGPVSYHWAHSMGVFSLGDPQLLSIGILAVAWGLLTPFLLWLSDRHYFRIPEITL